MNKIARRCWLIAIVVGLVCLPQAVAQEPTPSRKFRFGNGLSEIGVERITEAKLYSREAGFGFEPGAKVLLRDDGVCTADKPFYFSVALPEGNYTVTLKLGDPTSTSTTTVKAEMRRLMLENVTTPDELLSTWSFVVNIRTSKIKTGGEVRLKDREKTSEKWTWDEKLTLEFNGSKPCVSGIDIVPANVPTVYLLGDSTVCDQPSEPYASWGQMLPRFFGSQAAVANYAQSGESLRSTLSAKRLEKVLSGVRKGDYLLMQFGHNDMKSVTAEAYKIDLKRFADDATKLGANVVLVTPMHRRTFREQKLTNSLKDFPDAVRSLAREQNLPLIDLHAMSKALYESLGPDKSGVLFKTGDGTHHNNYGAYQLAKCVVEDIRTRNWGLAKLLVDNVQPYDPAKPDPVEKFKVPSSPGVSAIPPDGK